ncbi:MAG: branched-chain amino acid ABC transporter permease [Desulfatiglandaceae bacterium]
MKKNRVYNRRAICLGGLPIVCFLFLFPFFVNAEKSYLVYCLFLTFLYIALAQGWNIIGGYAGQPSLGQHAFFGVGAYLMAMSWKAGWTGYLDPLAMFIAGIGAALLAAVIGIPLLSKLRGDYFALGTLGLGEILRVVFTQGGALTGGPEGLMLPSSEYTSIMPFYFIAFFMALLSLLCIWILARSRVGLALIAIREDEQAAAANGIHVLKFKIIAFAMSGFFTGLCGCLFGYSLFIIDPAGFFSLKWALLPVLMTIMGGIGTIMGPIVGAFVWTTVFQLADIWLPEIHPIFSGTFIILIMLFLPGGLMSLGKKASWRKTLQGMLPFRLSFRKREA